MPTNFMHGDAEFVQTVVPGYGIATQPQATRSREIQSSLLFQMCLYFHLLFDAAYFVCSVVILRWKRLNYHNWSVDFVTPIIFALWTIVEISRLYVGYSGNLLEKVPHLAAFLFLTVFPQFLFVVYLVGVQRPMLPFDRITNGMLLALLVFEMIVGYRTLRRIISVKSARFALELGSLDTEPLLYDRESQTLRPWASQLSSEDMLNTSAATLQTTRAFPDVNRATTGDHRRHDFPRAVSAHGQNQHGL